MMMTSGRTVPHQHTCPSSALEDIIDTLYAKGTAFPVISGTDSLRHSFRLLSADILVVIWVIRRRSEVGLAADQYDWNCRPTDRSHFFYPLVIHKRVEFQTWEQGRQLELTLTVTFSRESGVSIAYAIKIT